MGLGEDHQSERVGLPCYISGLTATLGLFTSLLIVALPWSFLGSSREYGKRKAILWFCHYLFWDDSKRPWRHNCGAFCIGPAQCLLPHGTDSALTV